MKRFVALNLLMPALLLGSVCLLRAQAPAGGSRIGISFAPTEEEKEITVLAADDACWIDLDGDAVCGAGERLPRGQKHPIALPGSLTETVLYGAVTYLNCANTAATALDLSGTALLSELWCYTTDIETIDVSGQPELTVLVARSAPIKSLDLSKNPRLRLLSLQHCASLEQLDVPPLSELQELYIDRVPVQQIDLTHCPALTRLSAEDCGLTGLDLTACPELTFLQCSLNDLDALDLSGQTKLEELTANMSGLKEIDVSGQPNLRKLHLGGCRLTSIDLSRNPRLEDLNLNNNKLTSTDFLREVPQLRLLAAKKNAFTGNPDLSGNPLLEKIQFDRCQFTEIDLSHNPNVVNLYLQNNRLTSIDLSAQTKLQDLILFNNALTELDLSGCPQIQYIDISVNHIRGEGMDRLVASLPVFQKVSDLEFAGRFVAIDLADEEEQNKITEWQVGLAGAKEWTVLDSNGGDLKPYAGSDTGIGEIGGEAAFGVVPGSAAGCIRITGLQTAADVLIYDLCGRLIARQRLSPGDNSVDLSSRPQGTYLCRIGAAVLLFSLR